MSKRTQFQLQQLKSKLLSYQQNLDKFLIERENILSSTNYLINATYQDNKKHLLKKKETFLNDMKTIKDQINIYKNKLSILDADLQHIPVIIKTKLTDEQNIYNDDIETILHQQNENQQYKLLTIQQLENDKCELVKKLEILKQELGKQMELIHNIQSQEHQSRKNIINQLHQKKQQKREIQSQIDQLNYTCNTFYIDNINKITSNITGLQDFKILFINTFHNNDIAALKHTIMQNKQLLEDNNLFAQFNTFIMDILDLIVNKNDMNINPLILLLDNTIIQNEQQINNINNKHYKALYNAKLQMDNLQSPGTSIKIGKHNKVESFKTEIKQQKYNKDCIQTQIHNISNTINNYDSLVILPFLNTWDMTMKIYEDGINNANHRKNTMILRINTEHNDKKVLLENEKNLLLKNIADSSKEYNLKNVELNDLLEKIKILDAGETELEQINEKIIKIQNVIQQINSDITSLENNNY